MQEIGIAVVGLGGIARRHIMGLRTLPVVRQSPVLPVLRILVTRSPAEREAEARAMGFERVTSSLDAALADPAVRLVDICTPNALHEEAVMAALAAGKSIYCEKPLGASLAEAERMAAAAAASGLPHQVALVFRYHPSVPRIKALLEGGALGRLLQFRATFNHSGYLNAETPKGWRSQSELSGGGGLLDLGVHIIDLAQFLVGQLRLVHGTARTLVKERKIYAGQPAGVADVDDWALLHVESEAGVPGVVETSRIALGRESCVLELYGSNGSIICDLFADMEPRVRLFSPAAPAPEVPARQYLPSERLSMGWAADAHQAALYHCLLRVAGQDPTPGWAPTFGEALAAERLVYEALGL